MNNFAAYCLSFSLLALAGGFVYFASELAKVRTTLPVIISDADGLVDKLGPQIARLDDVELMVAAVLQRVDKTHEQVPDVLVEVASIRNELAALRKTAPVIVAESEQLRQILPDVLSTVDDVSSAVELAADEIGAYRPLLPQVIEQVALTRDAVPAMLDQAEGIVAQARTAGKEAAEGTVSGVFTGIFKAPGSLVSSLPFKSKAVETSLTDDDKQQITGAMKDALATGKAQRWRGESGNRGTLAVVRSFERDGQACLTVSHEIYIKKTGKTYTEDRDHCGDVSLNEARE